MTAARLRVAFVASSAAWALLLLAAPLAASRPHASSLASVLIVGVYSIGSLVCHQLPERSYQMWTAQMPVCARCAGIYVGAAVAAILGASFRNRARGFQASAGRSAESLALHQPRTALALHQPRTALALHQPRTALALHQPRVALALAVAPTLFTLAYEWTTGDMPSHAIRAVSGVPLGVVVAWLVVAAADNQVD